MTEDGPEIVAVISATATDRTGRDVSMAVALEGPFAGLLDQMERGARPGGMSGAARTCPTVGAMMAAAHGLGARFIRP
jgi:hypothetical protein